MIRVRADCPACLGIAKMSDIAMQSLLECHCGQTKPIDRAAICDYRIDRCPLCGTGDLYIQKDFPQRIGVAVVAAGVVLATVAWAYRQWFLTIGILVLFFAIDWLLFHTRPDVTICYRCLAQFRGAATNPNHRPFDLGIGERYRQERIRKRSMRGMDGTRQDSSHGDAT